MIKMAHNNTAPVVKTTNHRDRVRNILLLIVVVLLTLSPLALAALS